MTINPKPDLSLKSMSEQAMVRQSLNNARSQMNQTEDLSSAPTRQDSDAATAVRAASDTVDLSSVPETKNQFAEEQKTEITSISTAEQALETVSKSILNDPEQAMQAQANALPKSVMELIQ
jgi:hypothetical protein